MARRRDLVEKLEKYRRFALRQTTEQRAFHRLCDDIRLADESFALFGKAQQRRAPVYRIRHSGDQSLRDQLVESDRQIGHRKPEQPGQLPVRCGVIRVDENEDGVVDPAQRERLSEVFIEDAIRGRAGLCKSISDKTPHPAVVEELGCRTHVLPDAV